MFWVVLKLHSKSVLSVSDIMRIFVKINNIHHLSKLFVLNQGRDQHFQRIALKNSWDFYSSETLVWPLVSEWNEPQWTQQSAYTLPVRCNQIPHLLLKFRKCLKHLVFLMIFTWHCQYKTFMFYAPLEKTWNVVESLYTHLSVGRPNLTPPSWFTISHYGI